jgi:hypothetical protein
MHPLTKVAPGLAKAATLARASDRAWRVRNLAPRSHRLRATDRFVIYVDRQLLAAPRLLQIRTHFHLPPQRTIARADPHYRSTRSIGPL